MSTHAGPGRPQQQVNVSRCSMPSIGRAVVTGFVALLMLVGAATASAAKPAKAPSGQAADTSPPTLTVNPSSDQQHPLRAPDQVTVSWGGVSAPTARDWIGVYHSGDLTLLAKVYDNSCTTTPGTTALDHGSCTFTIPGLPNVAGTYELRLFSNDSNTLLATSNLVTVGQGATLTVNPLSLHAGDPVTVSWDGDRNGLRAPSSHDWVGVYHPGDPNNTPLGGFYDNSCIKTAGTTALASGSCTFVLPNLPNIAGTYVLRLFSNNSLTLLATSDPVTVSAGGGSLARAKASRTSRLFPLRRGL